MIGELHLTERGDPYVLKREMHVLSDSRDGGFISCSAVMCIPAGAVVYLLCVLVYPSGYREACVECESMILHVPVGDLEPQRKEGG